MVLKQFDPVSLFLLLLMWTLFKGQYTRGVLLPEHAPGSFCMCQYTQGSVFKFAQFALGACSQTFNLLNIVEHFAGWKFCSRGWSIPMKSLVHTEDLCSRRVPGACSRSKIPRVYRPLRYVGCKSIPRKVMWSHWWHYWP